MTMNLRSVIFPAGIIVSLAMAMISGGCTAEKSVELPDGTIITDKKIGDGVPADFLDRVTINYTGFLEDGAEFDSSLKPGREALRFTIGAGEVIEGLEEGVKGMKPGGKRTLVISPERAYGKEGIPGSIPPDATLMFEVELIKAERFD